MYIQNILFLNPEYSFKKIFIFWKRLYRPAQFSTGQLFRSCFELEKYLNAAHRYHLAAPTNWVVLILDRRCRGFFSPLSAGHIFRSCSKLEKNTNMLFTFTSWPPDSMSCTHCRQKMRRIFVHHKYQGFILS